ncbi:nuclear transport factor 2 family protein [Streptomyces phaeofaciens]|uniref:nuclear transport factor 2 family protein n=1 Tax=Streptomyces phaeofaciens TaxID=68254 RepID=UPI0036CB70D7
MRDESERAIQAAIDAELRLLDPEVRASPSLVRELLDPEFTEFGASGRRWDLESVLALMGAETVSSESSVNVSEMSAVVLAPGIVHLTYVTDDQGRRAWRSSLWRRAGTAWRMYFHQATLVPSEAA